MAELGPAPEFGKDGEDPPIKSPPSLVAEEFSICLVSRPRRLRKSAVEELLGGQPRPALPPDISRARQWLDERTLPELRRGFRNELSENLPPALGIAGSYVGGGAGGIAVAAAIVGGPVGLAAVIAAAGVAAAGAGILSSKRQDARRRSGQVDPGPQTIEVRRVQLYKRWVREDPVTQLAPGSSATKEARLTVGLSDDVTQEISGKLGLSDLGAELSSKLTQTSTATEQHEYSRGVTLDSPEGVSRKYAVWHVEGVIKVDVLGYKGSQMAFLPLTQKTFTASSAAVLTSIDTLPRRSMPRRQRRT
ncbi:hypothetical protein ACI78V_22670 [Geodermatophilus sp. SYSU D00742]